MKAMITAQKMPHVLLWLENGNSFGRSLARGVARYTRLHGPWSVYRLRPFYQKSGSSRNRLHLPSRKLFEADGIIAHVYDENHAREIIDSGLPAVVTYIIKPIPGVINIVSDNDKIGRMGAEHFLDRKFSHFCFCGFDEEIEWSVHRAASFCQRVQAAGYPCHIYRTPRTARQRLWINEQHGLARWLTSLPRPAGILACNDARAQDITEVCKLAGLKIPEDISVLGVDNDDAICELSDPPISSIPQSAERAGYEAAALLNRMMLGEKPLPQQVWVHPQPVIVRQSTDILAVDDEVVAQAARFIKRYATSINSVEEVAREVCLSLRQLQKRFSRALGVSISDEIRRCRMQAAVRFLVETTIPVADIATNIGYQNPTNLARSFRSVMGMNLSEYRRKFGRGG